MPHQGRAAWFPAGRKYGRSLLLLCKCLGFIRLSEKLVAAKYGRRQENFCKSIFSAFTVLRVYDFAEYLAQIF